MTTTTDNRTTLTSADGTCKLDYTHTDDRPAWSKSTASCQACTAKFGFDKSPVIPPSEQPSWVYAPQHFLSLFKVKYATYAAGEPTPVELTRTGTLVSDYRSLYRKDVMGESGDEKDLGVIGDEMTLGQVSEAIEALDLNCQREGCWRDVVAELVNKLSLSSFT